MNAIIEGRGGHEEDSLQAVLSNSSLVLITIIYIYI